MAEIHIIDITSVSDLLIELKDRVSERRQSAYQKAINEQNALISVASEVILSYALKQNLPLSYKTNKKGKPFIPTLPFFNISHSGKYVVCAVSNKEVGVDIEKISRMRIDLSRRILSSEESRKNSSVSGAGLQKLLCEKWVRKEAYLKMTGDGLRKPMTSLSFDGDRLEGEEVFSRVYNDFNGYLISFCRQEEVPVSIIEVTKQDLFNYYFEQNESEAENV